MAKRKKKNEENIDNGRQAVLDKALGDIEKRFGEGAIMKLGDAQSMITDVIPTGSLSLDIALGVGGVPRGRITEIYGPESSGKTTICQHIVAEAQALGGTAAFIDMEHALDPGYAAQCGVDIDNHAFPQPLGRNGSDTHDLALSIFDGGNHGTDLGGSDIQSDDDSFLSFSHMTFLLRTGHLSGSPSQHSSPARQSLCP